jgi:catechol 2,3-dioxygenase-like lactoylglutathione lyase family enzyme/ketosteroid isomerase-like protein
LRLEQIDHVAIWVRDVERSIAWYRDVLGFERRHPEWGTYPAMVCTGSTCIALFELTGSARSPSEIERHGMRHLAFRTDRPDFEQAQVELKQRAIEYVFQDHGSAHSIYFRDPDDYELEITTYELEAGRSRTQPHENVALVKKFIPPSGTDYRDLFGDDAVWSAAKSAVEHLLEPDFEGAFVAWGQRLIEFKGLEGLREAFLQWLAPWTSYYDEIESVSAAGDDRVVVLGREHGHRLDTGAEVEAESAGVYVVRSGKIASVEYYAKRAEASESVRLAEREARRS